MLSMDEYSFPPLDYVRKNLSMNDKLCQIAEEAAELAQAALKYKRALDGTNPTPVDTSVALKISWKSAQMLKMLFSLRLKGMKW